MDNNTRPRSHSVGGGERNRQHIPNAIPPELALPIQHISPPPSFPFASHPAGLYSDPLDDFLRSLTATYNTDPFLQHHQYTQPLASESDLSSMPPHQQQLDSTALAWLQLLHSQVPPQHDSSVDSSGRVQANVQEHPERPSHLPDNTANPEEESDSEAERAMTEDKRRRNTAASARFRNKKKQWLSNMERTVTSLSRRVDELEREAADLRRENGWLKEIVMLRTRKLTSGGPVNFSRSVGDRDDAGQPDTGKGKQRQQ